jgi:hypothetical protein
MAGSFHHNHRDGDAGGWTARHGRHIQCRSEQPVQLPGEILLLIRVRCDGRRSPIQFMIGVGGNRGVPSRRQRRAPFSRSS